MLGLIAAAVLNEQFTHYPSPLGRILHWFDLPEFTAGVGSRLSSPCSALAAVALLILSGRKWSRWNFVVLGLCGSLITSISLEINTGYLLGIAGPQFVPYFPQISPVTAGAFFATAASILLLAISRESTDVTEVLLRWVPVCIVGVASVGITSTFRLVVSAEADRWYRAVPIAPHTRLAGFLLGSGWPYRCSWWRLCSLRCV